MNVVARVVNASFAAKGWSFSDTNGELYVDLALINRGNQAEIIRAVFLCFSEEKGMSQINMSWGDDQPMNLQLTKGEKRVMRLKAKPEEIQSVADKTWLGVGVKAVAPDASDVVCVWLVGQIRASKGDRGTIASEQTNLPPVQVISNKRMPNQRDGSVSWP